MLKKSGEVLKIDEDLYGFIVFTPEKMVKRQEWLHHMGILMDDYLEDHPTVASGDPCVSKSCPKWNPFVNG